MSEKGERRNWIFLTKYSPQLIFFNSPDKPKRFYVNLDKSKRALEVNSPYNMIIFYVWIITLPSYGESS